MSTLGATSLDFNCFIFWGAKSARIPSWDCTTRTRGSSTLRIRNLFKWVHNGAFRVNSCGICSLGLIGHCRFRPWASSHTMVIGPTSCSGSMLLRLAGSLFAMICTVSFPLEVQTFSLNELTSMIFCLVLGYYRLALDTSLVSCRVITTLICKLICRGCQNIQSYLILSSFSTCSVHSLMLDHASIEKIIELASLTLASWCSWSPLLG